MFRSQGIEPGGMPPAEYAQVIRKDLAQWKKTIAELGIKMD